MRSSRFARSAQLSSGGGSHGAVSTKARAAQVEQRAGEQQPQSAGAAGDQDDAVLAQARPRLGQRRQRVERLLVPHAPPQAGDRAGVLRAGLVDDRVDEPGRRRPVQRGEVDQAHPKVGQARPGCRASCRPARLLGVAHAALAVEAHEAVGEGHDLEARHDAAVVGRLRDRAKREEAGGQRRRERLRGAVLAGGAGHRAEMQHLRRAVAGDVGQDRCPVLARIGPDAIASRPAARVRRAELDDDGRRAARDEAVGGRLHHAAGASAHDARAARIERRHRVERRGAERALVDLAPRVGRRRVLVLAPVPRALERIGRQRAKARAAAARRRRVDRAPAHHSAPSAARAAAGSSSAADAGSIAATRAFGSWRRIRSPSALPGPAFDEHRGRQPERGERARREAHRMADVVGPVARIGGLLPR
jgi:hypothetical protein